MPETSRAVTPHVVTSAHRAVTCRRSRPVVAQWQIPRRFARGAEPLPECVWDATGDTAGRVLVENEQATYMRNGEAADPGGRSTLREEVRPMKALIAYDSSPGAETALALGGAIRWPPGSTLRVIAVAEPATLVGGRLTPGIVPPRSLLADLVEFHKGQVSAAALRIATDHAAAEGAVIEGRPATAIVEEADRFGADVVITGSRGQGRVARLLLGSVAEEVVDRATSPVLVARAAAITRVVLAVDGSEPARAAEMMVSTWPIFEPLPIHVLSVADVMEPVRFGLAPARYHQAAEEHARYFAEVHEERGRLAQETAGRLRAAGRHAEAEMRTGGASEEIIAFSSAVDADLVVIGSRERSGLERIVLGSVARNVLHGCSASVLIVRGRTHS